MVIIIQKYVLLQKYYFTVLIFFIDYHLEMFVVNVYIKITKRNVLDTSQLENML